MSDEFVFVPNQQVIKSPKYSFFGVLSHKDIQLGVSHPKISCTLAKKILSKKYGPSKYEYGDGKTTFEYTFINTQFPNVYFRIYDYRGSMSCGFGIPDDLVLTPQIAAKLNSILARLITTVYLEDLSKEKEKKMSRRIKIKKKLSGRK